MKRFLFIGIIALFFWACSTGKESAKATAARSQNNKDSSEYQIRIIDPFFNHWYLCAYSEAYDHTNDYYRSRDQIAAVTWNDYYRAGQYSDVIDSYIDYQPDIDYGIEVNRTLYWYFSYLQLTFHIRLYSSTSLFEP
ncbi:MAG: DUF6146 family protein [Bacteroidales bacterium]|jgi:hypothetical protein